MNRENKNFELSLEEIPQAFFEFEILFSKNMP